MSSSFFRMAGPSYLEPLLFEMVYDDFVQKRSYTAAVLLCSSLECFTHFAVHTNGVDDILFHGKISPPLDNAGLTCPGNPDVS
jgi:hypothetical protein